MSSPDIQFRLLSVRPGLFAERPGRLPTDLDSQVGVSYAPAFSITFDESEQTLTIGALVHALVAPLGEEPENVEESAADAEVVCVYAFEDLDPLRVDGAVQVPRDLLGHLVGMTLSTARGVLVARTRHPIFQQAPFPIVSPISFLDELVVGDSFDWVAPSPALNPDQAAG